MDSYVFKIKSGHIGFYQQDGGSAYIFLQQKPYSKITSHNWGQWQLDRSLGLSISSGVDEHVDALAEFVGSRHLANSTITEHRKLVMQPGDYHPRLNRGCPELFNSTGYEKSLVDEVRAFLNIYTSMEEIFNVVEPNVNNLQTFGHRIRELLIIACTEVEYLLVQILKDNGYPAPKNDRFTTNDYVKILPILRLNEYQVVLKMHPSLGSFFPFSNWNSQKPTDSLPWYNSYNKVKHNRGANEQDASLESLIQSVAAIHVLLVAQYGDEIFSKDYLHSYNSCFTTSVKPILSLDDLSAPLISLSELRWQRKIGYFSLQPV